MKNRMRNSAARAAIFEALVLSALNAALAWVIVVKLLDGPLWAAYVAYLIMGNSDRIRRIK